MFRKDRQERTGGGVIMYIKDFIQAYKMEWKRKQNATLTIGLIYRSPNIRQEDDE